MYVPRHIRTHHELYLKSGLTNSPDKVVPTFRSYNQQLKPDHKRIKFDTSQILITPQRVKRSRASYGRYS